jgi:hypothetical protein
LTTIVENFATYSRNNQNRMLYPLLDQLTAKFRDPSVDFLRSLKALPTLTGGICELTAPFLPAPLIDLAKECGLESWSRKESTEVIKVYFYRPPSEDSDRLVRLD